MLTQLDEFLTAEGLVAGLWQAQTEVRELPLVLAPETLELASKKKLSDIKNRLKRIFFDGLTDEEIAEALRVGRQFSPDYPALLQLLRTIFADDASLNKIPTPEAFRSLPKDWTPGEATVDAHYQELNARHGYFQDASKETNLKQLFTQLVVASRSIAVLVEQNITDDEMPYDYAYKLMALFVDEAKAIPSVKQLSRETAQLLATQTQGGKPFHDVILVKVQLPNARKIKDRCGWIKFIKAGGEQALPYFTMAEKLEEHSTEKAPATLKKAKEAMTLCTFDRAASDLEFAKLCYDYKVSEKTFNSCLDYMALAPTWPKKTADTLPNIVIKGQGVMEGDKDLAACYYWVKLPPTDKRALILGKITDCCQSIGDDANQCVEDAVSLSDNGLYVLLKHKRGDKAASPVNADGSISDNFQIIGQSYAWKSRNGNICLDSIECLRNSVPNNVLKKILVDFATQVMEEDVTIKRVNVGRGGKTPRRAFNPTGIPEAMRQGAMYGDSNTQYCIKSLSRPISAEQRANLDQVFARFNCSELFKECVDYLFAFLAQDTTEMIKQLRTLLEHYPNFKDELQPWSLLRFLSLSTSPKITDFYPVDLDKLEVMTIEQQAETPRDISLAQLVWNVSSSEGILRRLPFLPIDQRLMVLKEKDEEGNNFLHLSLINKADHTARLSAILSLLNEAERFSLVKEKNKHGQSALHLAAENRANLAAILKIYPESQRIAAVEENDAYGASVLAVAAMDPDFLTEILALYPVEQRLEVVKKKNILRDCANENTDSLAAILALYPEDQRLDAVKIKGTDGKSILHCAAKNPHSLAMILKIYPEGERLEALKEKDMEGRNVLLCATSDLTALTTILKLYPKDQLLELVVEDDNNGNCALHYVVQNPAALAAIIEIYPEEQRLDAMMKREVRSGVSILYATMQNQEDLLKLLFLLPADQRLTFAKKLIASTEWGKDRNAKRAFLDRVSKLPQTKTLELTHPTDEPAHGSEDNQPNKMPTWRRIVIFFQVLLGRIMRCFTKDRKAQHSGDAQTPKKQDSPPPPPYHGKGGSFFGTGPTSPTGPTIATVEELQHNAHSP